jgi:hypothetical protein
MGAHQVQVRYRVIEHESQALVEVVVTFVCRVPDEIEVSIVVKLSFSREPKFWQCEVMCYLTLVIFYDVYFLPNRKTHFPMLSNCTL